MEVKESGSPAEERLLAAPRATRSKPSSRASSPPHPAQALDSDHPTGSPQASGSMDGALPGGSQPADTTEQQSMGSDRPLNVSDALSYLDSVKLQFAEQPEVYNKFLDIMKDFKSQLIDTPGVIERVSNLFHGHPSLIQGFNTFLPAGYRIETSDNPDPNYITVTTPAGTTTQATNAAFKYTDANTKPQSTAEKAPNADSGHDAEAQVVSQETLKPALEFVQKIRTRYANQPDVYKQFLLILAEASGTSQNKTDIRGMESWSVACLSAKYPQGEVLRSIMGLLKDSPDLMRDFVQFLPDEQVQKDEFVRIAKLEETRKVSEAKSKRVADAQATAVGQKRKRKPVDRDKEKEKEPPPKATGNKKAKMHAASEAPSPALAQRQVAAPPSPIRAPAQPPAQTFYPHHQQTVALPPPIPVPTQATSSIHPTAEAHFFERVKRVLDNRETYHEFLKLVNLFTQDIINSTRLVREARSFIGDGELMAQFKDILGWDTNKERMAALEESWTRPMGVLDRPSRNQLHTRYGSYRKLPSHEVNVQCSGRDEMCNSVLNDEWISQPNLATEDSGFIPHKKNQYEEALHRSEEERHEYDFHVEAIHRTIQVLEPLNNKIAQLSPEERATFKLKPNLGGVGKAIHQRVIKKIYGRDVGIEVWAAMQEIPATAIPLALMRLKQKHEEWKRAQREWDKVWREVDARNYHKSLDHQAVTFKAADKKAITQKAFVSQIEAARDEQRVGRASLIDPLFARTKPRHQLEFVIEDPTVLQDTLKLALSFLDRTQGQISLPDRRKIETFMRSFVPLFFMLDSVAFNAAFVPHHETVDSEMETEAASEDLETTSVNGSTSLSRSRNKKTSGNNAGDLRKRLLKSEQAKFSRRTRAQEAASSTPSRFASPVPSEVMQVDQVEVAIGRNDQSASRRRGTFYTNTAFFVLLRLLEMLYSRLYLFKTLAKEMADRSDDPFEPNPNTIRTAAQADLAKLGDRLEHASHFYELMLESCEKLFDNELEQHVFEEVMRYMFGLKHAFKIFTVDKVIGALIKQAQVILSDPKSQDLYELLRREREIASPTTQDLINCRRNTERDLGPDENLFRIDWLPEPKTITIQLIGKDDATYDDSGMMTGRWQAYIESFVSHHYTAGVPTSSTIRRPFLLRTKCPTISGFMPDVIARGGLQIKVCVRTYRVFFVSHSEDIMVRISSLEERAEARKLVEIRSQKRRKWLEEYASRKLNDEPESAITDVVPKLAAPTAVQPHSAPGVELNTEPPTANGSADIQMQVSHGDRESTPEVTVHTALQDDAIEVASAIAVAGPAPDPDPVDVPMDDVTLAPPSELIVPQVPAEVAPAPGPVSHPTPQPAPALDPAPAVPLALESKPAAASDLQPPSAPPPLPSSHSSEAGSGPSPPLPAEFLTKAPVPVPAPAPATLVAAPPISIMTMPPHAALIPTSASSSTSTLTPAPAPELPMEISPPPPPPADVPTPADVPASS